MKIYCGEMCASIKKGCGGVLWIVIGGCDFVRNGLKYRKEKKKKNFLRHAGMMRKKKKRKNKK